jgi:acid phosphatase family membrane protein YuiD
VVKCPARSRIVSYRLLYAVEWPSAQLMVSSCLVSPVCRQVIKFPVHSLVSPCLSYMSSSGQVPSSWLNCLVSPCSCLCRRVVKCPVHSLVSSRLLYAVEWSNAQLMVSSRLASCMPSSGQMPSSWLNRLVSLLVCVVVVELRLDCLVSFVHAVERPMPSRSFPPPFGYAHHVILIREHGTNSLKKLLSNTWIHIPLATTAHPHLQH